MRLLDLLLLVAAASIVVGVALVSTPAAFIVAGLELGLAWWLLGDSSSSRSSSSSSKERR